MRSVEMKNRCLLYYGNPVGYQTERGMVADTMFRREELEGWLARKGLSVRWEDGVYDRLSTGGYQALDHGPVLKSCRIWQLGPTAPITMRFIGLDRMNGEYGGPDISRYQVVFDNAVDTNNLDEIWAAFYRKPLGSDGASRWPSQTSSSSMTIPAASSTMWTARPSFRSSWKRRSRNQV